jgi:hypothetical protein
MRFVKPLALFAGVAAVAAGLCVASAKAQVYYQSGYNPLYGTYYQGATGYNPYYGTAASTARYYSPYSGNTLVQTSSYSPITGYQTYYNYSAPGYGVVYPNAYVAPRVYYGGPRYYRGGFLRRW